MATTTVTVQAGHSTAGQAGRRVWRAVRRNRKAATGGVLLLLFCLIALFPGVLAHDDPTAQIYPRNLGPSAAHLFGTSGLGNDLFAQAVWGTRQVLIIALGAGLAATTIAAVIGVTAAYLGGTWDGVLNLVTDVLLVIPLLSLIHISEPTRRS